MMKKILMASVATLGLMSVSAQAASQDINMSAAIAAYCTLGPDAGGNDVTIDPSGDGGIAVDAKTVTLPVECNGASTVTLSSANGGMVTTVPATANFTNFFDYTAVVNDGTADKVTLDTSTTATAVVGTAEATGGADVFSVDGVGISGNATVTITPTAPTSPLLAGDYADTLTVSVDPA